MADTVSLVYPPRCVVCRQACRAGTGICDLCCCVVERPMDDEVITSIREYFPETSLVDATALWIFEKAGDLQRLHSAMKYANQPFLAGSVATLLASHIRRIGWAADVVVPVPLHVIRLIERGYNQSEFVADGVGSSLGVPVRSSLLRRDRHTRTQTRLSARSRAVNLSNAFAAPPQVGGLGVLLVDDVITSGATATAASRALMDAGASAVRACALGFARR